MSSAPLDILAIAAHRDTFFRGLRNISRGDAIDVTTDRGVFRYVVDSTEVVKPDDVGVLKPGKSQELTLITCYPFTYIGSAPKRLVVVAEPIARATRQRAVVAPATR